MKVLLGKSSINGGISIAMFDVRLPDGNHTTLFFQLTSVEAAENLGVSKRRLEGTEPDVFDLVW